LKNVLCVHVFYSPLLGYVVVVVVRVVGIPSMRRINIGAIFAETINEMVVMGTEVSGETYAYALIGGKIFIALVHPRALQIIVNSLIVSIDSLPFVPTGILVSEVGCSLVTSSLPHYILAYVRLLHLIPTISQFQS
jgi:hypothetical protein